jgi:hypothetical protein
MDVDVEVVGVPLLSNQIRCFGIPDRCGKAHYGGLAGSHLASNSKADTIGRIVSGSLHSFSVVLSTLLDLLSPCALVHVPAVFLGLGRFIRNLWVFEVIKSALFQQG